MGEKAPFDIDAALAAVREAVAPYPAAALFELAEEGYRSLFEVLVGCIISVRTRDEDTLVVARRLFARARTPAAVAALSPDELLSLLNGTTFPEPKVGQIQGVARQAAALPDSVLPCEEAFLLALPGVGPKCANLSLGIACGDAPHVGVDVHVHRIANRWGYVAARTPEATMTELDEKLPPRYRVEINRLLVPFGKHVCTGILPRCSTCPVLSMCPQVGVEKHR
jgi:endonuclease-3